MSTDYRRYTTAELRDMPETARLEDERRFIYKLGLFSKRWFVQGEHAPVVSANGYTNSELARLLLRRIA